VELLFYGQIAAKYIVQLNDFYDNLSVESYVIMPNHIHILLRVIGTDIEPSATPVHTAHSYSMSGPSGTPVPTVQNSVVSRFISTFKRFCNKEYGQNIWQSRSYDHIIRDQRDFDQHLQYIYENPFAWQKDDFYVEGAYP
jgi:REP element-mobilizing transposase RayT